MLQINTYKLIFTLVLLFSFKLLFTQVYPIKENLITPKKCLEIKGKISYKRNSPYKVELIFYNTIIDSQVITNNKGFKFILAKNAYYTIKIYRSGHLPKLVSINTYLPESRYTGRYYKFEFSTSLLKDGKNYSDAVEFPIAIIKYDGKKDQFYYNEKYTSNIKSEIKVDNK